MERIKPGNGNLSGDAYTCVQISNGSPKLYALERLAGLCQIRYKVFWELNETFHKAETPG